MNLVAYYVEGDFPCAIVTEHRMGHLCGYVGVPPHHPWYGKDYDSIEARVHGGLTYGEHEQPGHAANVAALEGRAEKYANLPALPGRPLSDGRPNIWQRQLDAAKKDSGDHHYPYNTGQDVWWVGFDCAHLGDLVPGLNPSSGDVYRDEEYVRQEIKGLVSQAAAAFKQSQETPA